MVVGDIINDIFTPSIIQTVVPAAGIEIMVTSLVGGTTVCYIGLDDGVLRAYTDFDENVNIGGRNGANIKIGITNTHYLTLYGNGNAVGFSGIQIK